MNCYYIGTLNRSAKNRKSYYIFINFPASPAYPSFMSWIRLTTTSIGKTVDEDFVIIHPKTLILMK